MHLVLEKYELMEEEWIVNSYSTDVLCCSQNEEMHSISHKGFLPGLTGSFVFTCSSDDSTPGVMIHQI
jgi:hypothetical protein